MIGQAKAGYEYLLAYKITVPIYDYTVEFCERCRLRGVGEVREARVNSSDPNHPNNPYHPNFPPLSSKRTFDQMVQAARSGTQNIAEGSKQVDITSYIKLTGVNSGSLEELLKDFLAYARQNKLEVWPKEKVVREVREIGEVWGVVKAALTLPDHPNFPDLPNDPTQAVNLMITLINQAIYLQKKLKRSLEEKFINEGGRIEKLRKQHREKQLNSKLLQDKESDEWLKQFLTKK